MPMTCLILRVGVFLNAGTYKVNMHTLHELEIYGLEMGIMRKMLLLVLVCILCVSVVGCGSANCAYYECKNAINSDNLCFKHVAEKKELEIFLKAFESIEAAYEIGKEMNSDIDKAYHFEKNNEVTDSTSKQFIDELSISTEDFYVTF